MLSAEGAIKKWTQTTHGRSSSSTSYHAQVGNVITEPGSQSYEALPDAGIVRLFYLPHSRRLVNFEELADRPLPDGALTDKRLLVKDAVAGVFGSAEARAELLAIGHALTAQVEGDAAPPPAADTRPLKDALPGTWQNPMMHVSFGADGTVEATLPGGTTRQGRWSIDSSGRLVSDIDGTDSPVDAWVVDDTLTIAMGGQGIKLRRS